MFRKHCDEFLEHMLGKIQRSVDGGALVRIKRPRDTATPEQLRYEWAARRYCLGERYKDMATDRHKNFAIRKTVHRILQDIGLKKA
jgi:hypothetical protein